MPAAITAARARAKIFFIVSFPPFHVFNPGGLSLPAFRLQCHYTPPRTLSTVFCNSFVTDLSLYEKSPGQAGCFGADLGGMHRKQAIWAGSCRRGVFHIPLWKRRKKDARAAKKAARSGRLFQRKAEVYFSKRAATCFRSSTMGRCWGQLRSHLRQAMQSEALPWVLARFW